MIKIAIQKSGRLNEESLSILKKCGISIDNGKDQLKASARNFPMEVLYLRNGDIPQYLRDGVVDLAIIGENLIHEKGKDLTIIENLGFSKCRVSIAIPKEVDFNGIQELNDLLEMMKDKLNLNNYFEELYSMSIEEYLSSLTNYANQKISSLQKFVSDDFINNYSTSDKKSVNLCNAKMKMLLRGLRLHNIDNGLWLEFDASKDFEKTYGYLKNLATNRYIDPISRYEMRSCFSRIKFKYPNLSTDYNILTLKE